MLCCPACRMHGKVHDTAVAGEAQIAKATINCPHLRYPMTGVGANISLQDDALQVGLPNLLHSVDPVQGRQHVGSLKGQGGRLSAAEVYSCFLHSTWDIVYPVPLPCLELALALCFPPVGGLP